MSRAWLAATRTGRRKRDGEHHPGPGAERSPNPARRDHHPQVAAPVLRLAASAGQCPGRPTTGLRPSRHLRGSRRRGGGPPSAGWRPSASDGRQAPRRSSRTVGCTPGGTGRCDGPVSRPPRRGGTGPSRCGPRPSGGDVRTGPGDQRRWRRRARPQDGQLVVDRDADGLEGAPGGVAPGGGRGGHLPAPISASRSVVAMGRWATMARAMRRA
jgi:hypothetical protein